MAKETSDNPMPLGDHLDELRRRLILAIGGILPLFGAGLFLGERIFWLIAQPLIHELNKAGLPGELLTTAVLEGFMNYLKIAALFAIVLGGPWIIYQAWKFVAPGLYAREKRFFFLLAPMSVILSAAGLAFMYFLMLPVALHFFILFNKSLLQRPPTPIVEVAPGTVFPTIPVLAGDPADPEPGQIWLNTERQAVRVVLPPPLTPKPEDAPESKPDSASAATPESASTPAAAPQPLILNLPLRGDSLVLQQYKIGEYVNLVLTFAFAFVLTFQTPIVVLLLGWSGLVERATMAKYRRYVVMVCAIVSAVVTPADAVSMLMLGIPMYLLFELGMLLLMILPADRVARGFARKSKETRDGESPDGEDLSARPDDQ